MRAGHVGFVAGQAAHPQRSDRRLVYGPLELLIGQHPGDDRADDSLAHDIALLSSELSETQHPIPS
jgi:hypothetical protein